MIAKMASVSKGYTLDHSYLAYSKANRKKSQKFKVGRKMYKTIAHEYIKAIVEEILDNSRTVKLPFNMGEVRIKRCKTDPLPREGEEGKRKPDWATTLRLWKEDPECKDTKQLVYHFNDHSNGWYGRWFWSKQGAKLRNQTAYSFTPTRTNKRELTKRFKEEGGYKRYFQ